MSLLGFNKSVNSFISGKEELGSIDLDGECWQHCNGATETRVVLVFFTPCYKWELSPSCVPFFGGGGWGGRGRIGRRTDIK